MALAQAIRLVAGRLTVVAVGEDGADTVRLRAPTSVTAFDELPLSPAWVLHPGCGCTSATADDGGGA